MWFSVLWHQGLAEPTTQTCSDRLETWCALSLCEEQLMLIWSSQAKRLQTAPAALGAGLLFFSAVCARTGPLSAPSSSWRRCLCGFSVCRGQSLLAVVLCVCPPPEVAQQTTEAPCPLAALAIPHRWLLRWWGTLIASDKYLPVFLSLQKPRSSHSFEAELKAAVMLVSLGMGTGECCCRTGPTLLMAPAQCQLLCLGPASFSAPR